MLALLAAALLSVPHTTDDAALRAKTDAIFAAWNKPDSPGCAVAVYKDGAIVYEHGFGAASLELSVPITPQTVFDIGSTSKQFTATCVALLEQDGKLALDDDIRKYLTDLPPSDKTTTIRHLLNHTSGIRDYIELMSLAGIRVEDRTTCAEAYDAIRRQTTRNFAPGTQHLYSNSGYFLLGQIVERVSKKSLREFAHERIFEPLGMKHTEILDDCTHVVKGKANSYEPDERGFVMSTSDWEQTGDGAVQTSVEDLLLWDENFYSGKVGGKALKDTLLTRGKLDDGTVLDYCAGLSVGKVRGLEVVRHGGSWAGFRAELVRFPAQHLSVACLCNLGSMDASGLAQSVAEVWLADRMEPEKAAAVATDTRAAVEVAPEELAKLVGWYKHDDVVVRIRVENGVLALSGRGVRPGRLTPLGQNRFRREPVTRPLDVVFDKGAMRFEFPDGARWEFTSIEPWTPKPDELARFAGKYWSDEIGAAIDIELDDGALTIVGHRTLSPLRLTPLLRDTFTSNLGQIAFQSEKGAVTGFVVDGGRAKGLRYVKR